jgi:6-phospho-3-hexuloisomerase
MPAYTEILDGVLGELEHTLRSMPSDSLDTFCQALLDTRRVFVAGKGRSGLHLRAFAIRLMHLGLTVYVVDEATTPAVSEGDLLVIASGSGRTASLIQYATKARSLRAKVALLTAFPDSPLGQQADWVVLIPAPSPKVENPGAVASIQPMANLFEQSLGVWLDIATMQLTDRLGLTAEQMFARHANLE